MKILAIRGKNIASLGEPFSIELVAPPLEGRGVFALSGPTGAGKSSILDALCLALYASTPRLQRATKVQVPDPSGQAVPADAVAQLLRRGAGSGYAEAEFVGVDGEAYRARFTIRRAKGYVAGRFQAPVHELFLRDSQKACGGNNSETKVAIAQKLGLDFKQFTRAVLLAQNEFAAFLSADADERSTLLERLTGTERFGLISTQVFERAKSERLMLETMAQELSGTPALEAATRVLLEERIEAQATQLETLDRLVGALRAAATHLQRLEELRAAVEVAERDWRELKRRSDEIAPLRTELDRLKRVTFEARDLLQASERARSERQRLDLVVIEAERAIEAAKAGAALAASEEASARSLVADTGQRSEQLAPQLRHAVALDEQLLAARRAAQQQVELSRQVEARVAAAAADQIAAREQVKQLESDIAAEGVWLEQRPVLARLVEGWPQKREALTRAQARLAKIVSLGRDLGQATARDAEDRTAGSNLADAVGRRRQEWLLAVQDADQLKTESSRDDLDELERTERLAEQELQRLETLSELHEEQQKREAEIADLEQRFLDQRSENEHWRQANLDCQAELDRARNQCHEKSLELQGAERLVGETVEALRAALVPRAACPVCGSTEHPWGGVESGEFTRKLRAGLVQLRAEVAGLQRICGAREADSVAIAVNLSRGEGRLSATEQLLADHRASLGELSERLSRAPEHTEFRALDARARRQAFQERTVVARLCHENCKVARVEARQRRQQAELAATKVAEIATKLDNELTALRSVERALLESNHALLEAQNQLAALQREQTLDLEFLDADFGAEPWESKWNRDPGAFIVKLADGVGAWQKRQSVKVALERQLLECQARLPEIDRRMIDQQKEQRTLLDRSVELEAAISELSELRCAYWDGRAVVEVETEMRQEQQRNALALQLANENRHRAEQAYSAAQANRDAQIKMFEEATNRWLLADQALDAWIVGARAQSPALVADREELAKLIELGPTFAREAEAQIDAVRTALEQALGAFEQSGQARDAELVRGSTLLDALRGLCTEAQIELPESLNQSGLDGIGAAKIGERERLREERAGLLAERRRDDATRELLQQRLVGVEEQRKVVEKWSRLSTLIGSADGKKLRHLAQEVTLDLVLAHANEHLRELARRYQLVRLTEGLHIVVEDAELLGAARGTNSLSGGETFLVSLALALGLASLSAEKVRVETLFIDEGFGSLDGQTLQIAVAALDRIQARGCQVGIVSHVGELAERLGVEVRVEPIGSGRSRVRTVTDRAG